jgi:hypothetical protein
MWTRDGRGIVYAAVDASGARRLHLQPIEGGPPRAFGPEGAAFEIGSGSLVSPDGRWVAARDGERGWILVALDGSTSHPIPGVGKHESIRQWTADSRAVYVAGPQTDPRSIDRVEVATGLRTHVLDLGQRAVRSRGVSDPSSSIRPAPPGSTAISRGRPISTWWTCRAVSVLTRRRGTTCPGARIDLDALAVERFEPGAGEVAAVRVDDGDRPMSRGRLQKLACWGA